MIFSTILLFFIISSIGFSVDLNNGTVLNTSISNSSMTFSINATADLVTIESMNITLDNVTCATGVTAPAQIFWDTANTNLDSVEYCGLPVPIRCSQSNTSLLWFVITAMIIGTFIAIINVDDPFKLVMIVIGVVVMVVAIILVSELIWGLCY